MRQSLDLWDDWGYEPFEKSGMVRRGKGVRCTAGQSSIRDWVKITKKASPEFNMGLCDEDWTIFDWEKSVDLLEKEERLWNARRKSRLWTGLEL